VTPDIFAQENGKDGMAAEELKEWLANNDRYLREREGDLGSGDGTERKASFGALDVWRTRSGNNRRLQ
jgi:hypothetical protein